MVQDPALQISLNGLANHRRKPNENFRESCSSCFQLELVAPEQDVSEAARALTVFMNASRHLVLQSRRTMVG